MNIVPVLGAPTWMYTRWGTPFGGSTSVVPSLLVRRHGERRRCCLADIDSADNDSAGVNGRTLYPESQKITYSGEP